MDMAILPSIIIATLLGSICTLLGASFVLLYSKGKSRIFIQLVLILAGAHDSLFCAKTLNVEEYARRREQYQIWKY